MSIAPDLESAISSRSPGTLYSPPKTLICHPASLKIILFQGSRDSAFRVRRPGVSVACREGEVEDTVASESSTLMGCCWGPDDG